MPEENTYQRIVAEHRDTFKAIARQIRDNPVTVEVDGGAVSATALANGQLTDVYISARAQRGHDNQTLSKLVASAVQQAIRKAAKTELDGLHTATEGRVSSPNDVLGAAMDEIAAEIEEEDRKAKAETDRWSFMSSSQQSAVGRGRRRGSPPR